MEELDYSLLYQAYTAFRTGFLADACETLFYQMVKRLEEACELSKETVFIDGTKTKVKLEILLLCIGYNMLDYFYKIERGYRSII